MTKQIKWNYYTKKERHQFLTKPTANILKKE